MIKKESKNMESLIDDWLKDNETTKCKTAYNYNKRKAKFDKSKTDLNVQFKKYDKKGYKSYYL